MFACGPTFSWRAPEVTTLFPRKHFALVYFEDLGVFNSAVGRATGRARLSTKDPLLELASTMQFLLNVTEFCNLFASVQVCKFASLQVCKFASLRVCKGASVQVLSLCQDGLRLHAGCSWPKHSECSLAVRLSLREPLH